MQCSLNKGCKSLRQICFTTSLFMSFLYRRFRSVGKKRTDKEENHFQIDADVTVTVTSYKESKDRVDICLIWRKSRFSDNVVFDNDTYKNIKHYLSHIRRGIECVKSTSQGNENEVVRRFAFDHGLFVFVSSENHGQAFISFSNLRKRQNVTLNDKQFSVLENLMAQNIIDNAIDRLIRPR